MRFRIKGADSKTGQERVLEIESQSENEAIVEAKFLGVYPYQVSEIVGASAARRPNDRAAQHDPIRCYRTALDSVFAAAQRTVRDFGYKIDALDKANGLLNFKTGMSWKSWAGQEMSIMMIDNGDGTIEVSVTGRRNSNGVVLQIFDWSEINGIASQIFYRIDQYLQ